MLHTVQPVCQCTSCNPVTTCIPVYHLIFDSVPYIQGGILYPWPLYQCTICIRMYHPSYIPVHHLTYNTSAPPCISVCHTPREEFEVDDMRTYREGILMISVSLACEKLYLPYTNVPPVYQCTACKPVYHLAFQCTTRLLMSFRLTR